MDLIFNELSLIHAAANRYVSRVLMEKFLLTCKEARKFDFRNLRVKYNFGQWCLSDGYTIYDWLNDNEVRRDYKALLLGLKRYPFIEEGDESIETRYIKNNYYLNSAEFNELHDQETEGLAVAYLYNTLSISFTTHKLWENTKLDLFERAGDEEETVTVNHISSADHIKIHEVWLESKRPISLIMDNTPPINKKIKLRNDHGKDTLTEIANKLIRSPYVVEVINSLPYNRNEKQLFKQIYPDGKVEVVLHWTDSGIGLLVQTTGRNQQETNAICNIIKDIIN